MKTKLIKEIYLLIRPLQWVKNFFVFFPLFFSGKFFDESAIISSLYAFILFSIAASSVYVFNDIWDLESDRQHPKKSKTRPLAAARLSVKQAYFILMLILLLLVLLLPQQKAIILPIGLYLFLNLFYTIKGKEIPIYDVFSISAGFVLRVWTGSLAIGVFLSHWMAITTFCISLYLALIKRRQELVAPGNHIRRTVLLHYNVSLIDKLALLTSSATLIFYTLFVLLERKSLVLTIPLVFFGIFRYWYLVETQNKGESPTDVVTKDPTLILLTILWLTVCVYTIM
jgi:decaprenyl-phosphate phosphoribosyltransferase